MAITRRVSPEHFLIRFLFLHFHFRPSWSVIYFDWLENSANFKTSIDPFQIKRSSLSLSFLLRLLSSSILQCFLVWRLDDVVRVCLSANHASLKARDYLQFQCTVHDWRQKQRFLSLSLFSISNNELDVIGFDSARPKKWCNQNPSCLFIPSVGPAAGLLYYPRSEAFSLSPTYLPSPPLINNFYFIICLLAPRCIDCTDLVRWIRVCNPFFLSVACLLCSFWRDVEITRPQFVNLFVVLDSLSLSFHLFCLSSCLFPYIEVSLTYVLNAFNRNSVVWFVISD